MYIRRLISVIAAALSVGVCVFITYISRDADQSSIIFNLVFLAIMLLMLGAACIAGLGRLIQISRGLKRGTAAIKKAAEEGTSLSGSTPLFQNRFLDDCYQQYCRMSRRNPNASCDIRNFINEEAIDNYVHRGILELIPDILTSLGILGTFVGLVMGLREFDPSGYEQMAGSVSPLINGIKVAFITSIYGIALSLSYSFDLRSEFANLSALTEEFLDTYYLNIRPPYEMDSLSRLLKNQKDQEELTHELTGIFVEQMAKSFEQAITPAYTRMTEGINRIVDTFTENQTQVMTQICETVFRQIHQEMEEDYTRLSTAVSDLQKAQNTYTDFLDRSMVRIQQTFVSMQDNLASMDQYSSKSLEQLGAAQKEALRINQEQNQTYQEYIRFMYQSIEKFSQVWEQNIDKMQSCTDEIARSAPVQSSREIREALDSMSTLLADIQKRQIAASLSQEMASADSEQARLLSRTLRKLDDLEEMINSPRLFRSRKKK